jgi:hypothetical protein
MYGYKNGKTTIFLTLLFLLLLDPGLRIRELGWKEVYMRNRTDLPLHRRNAARFFCPLKMNFETITFYSLKLRKVRSGSTMITFITKYGFTVPYIIVWKDPDQDPHPHQNCLDPSHLLTNQHAANTQRDLSRARINTS